MARGWSVSRKPMGWRNESYRHYLAAKGVTTSRYLAGKANLKQFLMEGNISGAKHPKLTDSFTLRKKGDMSVPSKTSLESLGPGEVVEVELARQKPKQKVQLSVAHRDSYANWYVGEVISVGPLQGKQILFRRKNVLRRL